MSQSKLIYSVVVSSSNIHNSPVLGDLLHGDEWGVYGGSAYMGQEAQVKVSAEQAKDFTHKRGHRKHPLTDKERQANRSKSNIRRKRPYLINS